MNNCPRCGSNTFEKLKTHDYCPECNWAPEFEHGKKIKSQSYYYPLNRQLRNEILEIVKLLNIQSFKVA